MYSTFVIHTLCFNNRSFDSSHFSFNLLKNCSTFFSSWSFFHKSFVLFNNSFDICH